MVRLGKIMTVTGFFITIFLLGMAFWYLFNDKDDISRLYFMMVPFSFIMLFAGFATSILLEPRSSVDPSDIDKL